MQSHDLAKNLLVPFLIGGTTIAVVKFVASNLHNPALAAIFGGVPVGLVSLYFVANSETLSYAVNYFYVTMILGISILTFYFLHTHTSWSKNTVLAVSLVTWLTLAGGKYLFEHSMSHSTTSPSPPGVSQSRTALNGTMGGKGRM